MEDLVQQLKEEVSTLSAFLDEERKKHKKAVENLHSEHQNHIEAMGQEHRMLMQKHQRQHDQYVALLKRHHKSTLGIMEETFQDRIKRLRNEYALLQAALRNYKDLIRSDMVKKWAEKEDCIRLEHEDRASEIVLKARYEMEREFELQKTELVERYEVETDKRVREAVEQAMATMLHDPEFGDKTEPENVIGEDAENMHESECPVLEESTCNEVTDCTAEEHTIESEGSSGEASILHPSSGSVTNEGGECYDGSSDNTPRVIFTDREVFDSDTAASSLNTQRDSDLDKLVLESISDEETPRHVFKKH